MYPVIPARDRLVDFQYLAAESKPTKSSSGFRGVSIGKICCESTFDHMHFPVSSIGMIAAAVNYDRVRGKPPNFLPNGHRNPASMIHADCVHWTRGEYIEPILTLSATERAELVALLIEKNVTVPEYLKPKP